MGSDELRLEEPDHTERPWFWTVLLMAVPLALVWAVAFWVTGLLWWDAGVGDVSQVPPPQPAEVEAVDSATIDLERYQRARPSWTP